MNTPRTKKPKRWEPVVTKKHTITGSFAEGITDPAFLQALGTIVSTWPNVEQSMMWVFAELLNVMPTTTGLRQVYHSIINAQIRIKILKNLLEETHYNRAKGAEYDEIIDEFKSLNDIRNGYVHGLWYTHESRAVVICESSVSDMYLLKEGREVTLKELIDVIQRITAFRKRVGVIISRDIEQRVTKLADESSPQKLPQPA